MTVAKYDRFVIAACSHSGTTWISKVLTDCGLPCSHERVFDLAGRYNPQLWILGDASLAAAGHLSAVPPRTLILHQVRNPLQTITGWVMAMEMFDDPRQFYHTWEGQHGYGSLLRRYSWPLGLSAAYWCAHNRRIRNEAETARNSKPGIGYLQYRLEAVNEDFITWLGQLLGRSISVETAHRALNAVPKRVKAEEQSSEYRQRRAARELRSFDELPNEKGLREQVRTLAQLYGYTPAMERA